MTIAIVPWDGMVLTIELCDTAAAGVMTGKVISSTKMENGFTKTTVIKRSRTPKVESQEVIQRATNMRDYFQSEHQSSTPLPLYATARKFDPNLSGGQVKTAALYGERQKWWKLDMNAKPQTLSLRP